MQGAEIVEVRPSTDIPVVDRILFTAGKFIQTFEDVPKVTAQSCKTMKGASSVNRSRQKLTNSVTELKTLASKLSAKNSTVTKIDLGYKGIGDKGAIQVSQALSDNRTRHAVTLINLSYNNIGDDGAIALGQVLERDTTIRTLYLFKNNIGDRGAAAIARGLAKNTTLKEIDLWQNNIGDEGTKELAQALRENRTLEDIDLGVNNNGDEGATALFEALQDNESMSRINLEGNTQIKSETQTQIRSVCQENTVKRYVQRAQQTPQRSTVSSKGIESMAETTMATGRISEPPEGRLS